jgi:hypothetical protein
MTEAQQGLAVFILIAVVGAVFAHRAVRGFVDACLVSGIASSVVFQLVGIEKDGRIDKFALVAVVFCAIYTTLIAAVVGWPVRRLRR